MMKTKVSSKAYTDLNFALLEDAPVWRGAIDCATPALVSGWVLSAENPLSATTLELWVAGAFLGNVVANLPRDDISKHLKLPVKAGFSYDTSFATDENAAKVLTALSTIEKEKLMAPDLFDLRIAGGEAVSVAFSPLSKEQVVDLAQLRASLAEIVSKAKSNLGNRYIEIRDNLLSAPLPTRGKDDQSVQILAYYLPQFHPFPENNDWWGTGFSEWTNVTAGKAYFKGHHQPRLPADFGFYDLRIEQVQRDQIELAKKYGLTGFCYYYYWFSGKTLMTLPIDRHLEKGLEFDFCLCWANESWSRRWDGSESDVLMAQSHKFDDDVDFIRSCLKYFKSDRYIKINGAPVLQVYRISLLERPLETIAKWREIVKAAGFPNLHVTMVESFGLTDPYQYGCDSSCQFPPHGVVGSQINAEVEDLDASYTGLIFDYAEIVAGELARPEVSHLRFRGAMPSWDNTSRKGASGNVFAKSSPALFQAWLTHLIDEARRIQPPEAQIVMINAWNEWAEGAHLEPERKLGHQNLQAVRESLALKARAMAPLAAKEIDALDHPLHETRNYMNSVLRTNECLSKILAQPKYSARAGYHQAFVSVPRGLLNLLARTNASFNVDDINGIPIPRYSTIAIASWQGLGMSGWFHFDGHEHLETYIALKSFMDEDKIYVCRIQIREARPDALSAIDLPDESCFLGFRIDLSLNGVEPGKYGLYLLTGDFYRTTTAVSINLETHVLIG
jgi:hypothetical protein